MFWLLMGLAGRLLGWGKNCPSSTLCRRMWTSRARPCRSRSTVRTRAPTRPSQQCKCWFLILFWLADPLIIRDRYIENIDLSSIVLTAFDFFPSTALNMCV